MEMKTKLTTEQIERLYDLGLNVINLGEMLSILPKKITDRMRIYELKIWVDHYSDAWCIEYTNVNECSDTLDSFQSAEELCDAVYYMIRWICKNDNVKQL